MVDEFLICSPIPRFLFNGCCTAQDHCVGTDTADYVNSLLQETLALRGVCKSSIQALGKKNGWVPDLVGNLLPACNGIQEKAVGLTHIMSADGVHFTKHGYEKLAETLVKCCKTHLEKFVSAASSVSARPAGSRQKTFYWRGFASPVGGSRPSSQWPTRLPIPAAVESGGTTQLTLGRTTTRSREGVTPPVLS